MHSRLNKFSEYTNSLFPHELDYLLSIQKFEHSGNLKILNIVNYNSKNPHTALHFDVRVDKRRYSYMKNWMETQLSQLDVDLFYEWLISCEKSVLSDMVTVEQEKEILKKSHITSHTHYYFIKFYELMSYYRDYLLIRNRTDSYRKINGYLRENQQFYQDAIDLNTRINRASEDIVGQYFDSHTESRQWEELLNEVFFNKGIDGYTRYRAAVRLTYMYYNYRDFGKLRIIYEELDRIFASGIFYSRRILANYYANRAMMHSKLGELKDAEKFGWLAIRHENSDYIFYVLNLCGVLLKSNKSVEALGLMQRAIPKLRKTANYYYRIGFAAFYIRTLIANKHYREAADYAETFHNSYKNEINRNRWHLFYSTYFQALAWCENYGKIISLSWRYSLVELEKKQVGEARYLPVLLWYTTIADYMEGHTGIEKSTETIVASCRHLVQSNYSVGKIRELLIELSQFAPEVFRNVIERIKL